MLFCGRFTDIETSKRHDHGDTWCQKWNTTATFPDLDTTSQATTNKPNKPNSSNEINNSSGIHLCFGQHTGYVSKANALLYFLSSHSLPTLTLPPLLSLPSHSPPPTPIQHPLMKPPKTNTTPRGKATEATVPGSEAADKSLYV